MTLIRQNIKQVILRGGHIGEGEGERMKLRR
jgi:hypothetical protein